ncbi:ubiquitin-like protein-like protein SMT3, partial [Acephala macrosclerotiorum]
MTASNASGSPAPDSGPKPEEQGARKIMNVKVKDQQENETVFKIKSTTKLGKLMDAYCGQQGRAPGSLRFFTPDGKRITKTDTPTTLRLEDSDLIDAHEEQLGG